MAREIHYVVIRHGSNAANQSMTPRMAVGIVTARSRKEAQEIAEGTYDCYNNQHLELISESKASAADWNEAVEMDEARLLEEAI